MVRFSGILVLTSNTGPNREKKGTLIDQIFGDLDETRTVSCENVIFSYEKLINSYDLVFDSYEKRMVSYEKMINSYERGKDSYGKKVVSYDFDGFSDETELKLLTVLFHL